MTEQEYINYITECLLEILNMAQDECNGLTNSQLNTILLKLALNYV